MASERWYVCSEHEGGHRTGYALHHSEECEKRYVTPQWLSCPWRKHYKTPEHGLVANAHASKAEAKAWLDGLRAKYGNTNGPPWWLGRPVFVRVLSREETRQRAEARGEVRALEVVLKLGHGPWRASEINVMLADAKRRAGQR